MIEVKKNYSGSYCVLLSALLALGPTSASAQAAPKTAETQQTTAILKSIVVTPDSQASAGATGVTVSGLGAQSQALQQALEAYLGKAINIETLSEITTRVNGALATEGRRFSVASLPKQDISSGQLRVVVIDAKVGKITVRNAGTGTFTDDRYLSLLRIKPGDVLTADALDEDIDWINRSNPYRSAQVMTQAGEQLGQTDLELLVEDRPPYSFSLTYDNNGTRTTGRDRFTFTAGTGNLFGLDHQLNYTLNANQDTNKYASQSVNYVIPLPWHHLVSLSANASQLKPDLPAPFDQSGRSNGWGVRYDLPLPKSASYTQSMNVGFDYKASDNNLLFSQTPVTNTLTKIYQVNLGYSGALQDHSGQTSANFNLVHSPGNSGDNNNDVAFNASRAGASAKYTYWQLGLQRDTRLPQGWVWTIKGNLQRSDSNLLGSEQLSGGGFNSVRSFADAIVFGDEGLVLRTELVSPPTPIEALKQSSLQWLAYYDEANLSSKLLLPAEPSRTRVSSAGIGLRANLPSRITVRLDAGTQLVNDGPGANSENLVHIGISKVF